MDIFTAKMNRRSSRLRVEIPVTVTSMDRKRPFTGNCVVLVVSPHGCGFRSSCLLPVGTPILISNLPQGGSVTARVANCLPLGSQGQHFLIGAALYTHGNIWKIADPPKDWDGTAEDSPEPLGSASPHGLQTAGAASGRK